MVGLQTLDLAIGVRVPASQPKRVKHLRAAHYLSRPFCVPGQRVVTAYYTSRRRLYRTLSND